MENNFKYKRIMILGASGSGKSTLANRISQYTGYKAYHLDSLLLNQDWSMKDKSQWEDICQVFLKENTGIVDGNYSRAMPNRLNWADLVIFINIPTYLQLYRIISRNIRNKFGLDPRYGSPEGSRVKLSWSFIKWTYNWNSGHVDKIMTMLESAKDKKFIIINEPKKLDIKNLFN